MVHYSDVRIMYHFFFSFMWYCDSDYHLCFSSLSLSLSQPFFLFSYITISSYSDGVQPLEHIHLSPTFFLLLFPKLFSFPPSHPTSIFPSQSIPPNSLPHLPSIGKFNFPPEYHARTMFNNTIKYSSSLYFHFVPPFFPFFLNISLRVRSLLLP